MTTMAFTANEALAIAIRIEHNGSLFYRRAAETVGEKAGRTLLMSLADMETEHEGTFTEIQASLSAEERADSEIDADSETLAYLEAVADGHVFDVEADAVAILTGEETLEEILDTAIGLEKETVVYYAALQEVVTNEMGKRRIQEVLRQEMSHIATLSGQRAALPH